MILIQPAIGRCYQNVSELQLFEVVAFDEKYGTIEVQYEGGEIGEFDFDAWGQLDLVPAAAPDDGNAGYGFPPRITGLKKIQAISIVITLWK